MIRAYQQKMRLFQRDVWMYLISAAAHGAGSFGISAVLRNLYVLRLGYSPAFIGTATAITSVAWTLLALPAGALGRRWGVRRTMALGTALHPLALALFAASEFVPFSWRSAWVLATYTLMSAGVVLYIVSAYPALASATNDADRPYAFSLFLAIIPLAGFVGALIGGWLPDLFTRALGLSIEGPEAFRYSLWVGAAVFVPGLLALLSTSKRPRVSATPTARTSGPPPSAVIAVIALVALFVKAAISTPQSFYNVYLETELGLPVPRIGALMAIAQLVASVAVLGAPLLMARFSKHTTFALGTLGMAAGLLLLGLVPQWVAAGLGFAMLNATYFVADSGFHVGSQEAVAPGWRTTASGAAMMAEGLSRLLVGLAGSVTIVTYGYRPLFTGAAMLAVIAGVVFWMYFRTSRARTESPCEAEA